MKPIVPPQIRVWDPAVRLFHWSLVAAFAAAYLSGDEWMSLHVNAGYLIGALLVFRILWGYVGPRHARFRDFVRPPAEVVAYLRQAARLSAPRHLGHNPAGGAMILALLVSLALTVLSGIALYGTTDFAGPLAGLQAWGALGVEGDSLRLTREGLLQVDRLVQEFFLPEHRGARYA